MNLADPPTLMVVVMFAVASFSVCYFCGLAVLGIREFHKQGVSLRQQERLMELAVNPSPDFRGLHFYALVPCLNEERVIGATIQSFLDTQPGATLVVIDDGSEDRSSLIIDEHAGTGWVIRHSRVQPDAQRGKGQALNGGLRVVRRDVERRGLDPARVVVGVIDADGRLTPNALEAVAVPFAERPSVGGVQLAVRIRNAITPPSLKGRTLRDRASMWFQHMLLVVQDQVFWGMVALDEMGRNAFGSAAMGGNGQFVRLSCLNEIGDEPWTESLTEDLELGLSMCELGWVSVGIAGAYVSQQGVGSLRRMVRQWTRWTQGTMMGLRRVPALVRSRHMSNGALLEVLGVLVTPWAAMLWSFGEQFALAQYLTGHSAWHLSEYPLRYQLPLALEAYVVIFGPSIFWTIVYYQRARTVPFWKAVIVSHLLIPWSWMALAMTTRALTRIILRRGGWAKTARELEEPIEFDPSVLAPVNGRPVPDKAQRPVRSGYRPGRRTACRPSATRPRRVAINRRRVHADGLVARAPPLDSRVARAPPEGSAA